MSNQILSIYGLYKYDSTLFDGMKLPEGVSREILVPEILLELGVLETLYPDSDFMKAAIASWSAKECPTWEELYKTTQYEYDPISNYDRMEEMTVTKSGNVEESGSDERSSSGSGEQSASGSGEQSASGSGEQSASGNVTNATNVVNKTAAFNSADLENKEGSDTSGNENFENSGSNNFENNGSSSFENNGSTSFENIGNSSFDNSREFNETLTHRGVTRGNIGVTTTQQMIEAQRKVVEFNIYNYIIDSFKCRFCIMVY